MERQPHFLRRMWTGLPVIFPLVGLFHIAILFITIYSFAQDGVLDVFTPAGICLMLLAYAVLWIYICLQRRWAAIAYIILTAVNLCLQYLTPQGNPWRDVGAAMAPGGLPVDALMCFFLLFFYKRFH